jgi:hypothetical protein
MESVPGGDLIISLLRAFVLMPAIYIKVISQILKKLLLTSDITDLKETFTYQ